jgi:hypothetical protein
MPTPPAVPSPTEVSQAFHEELHPGQQSALISWASFTATFATVRVITHRIRDSGQREQVGGKQGLLHNLSIDGIHLHHYMWGILTISSVGGIGIRGEERTRRHPVVASLYGIGLALIVDEFALLLNLQDDYWSTQGRESVDVAIGLIATTGTVVVGLPVWRRLRRNRTGANKG